MTIPELKKLLQEDINAFREDMATAHTEEFFNISKGRLKEAEWILSKLDK